MTPRPLKGRHVQALLKRWQAEGLSAGTLQNRKNWCAFTRVLPLISSWRYLDPLPHGGLMAHWNQSADTLLKGLGTHVSVGEICAHARQSIEPYEDMLRHPHHDPLDARRRPVRIQLQTRHPIEDGIQRTSHLDPGEVLPDAHVRTVCEGKATR
jgi:hypothetical protein